MSYGVSEDTVYTKVNTNLVKKYQKYGKTEERTVKLMNCCKKLRL